MGAILSLNTRNPFKISHQLKPNLLARRAEALAIPLQVIINLLLSSNSSHMLEWAREHRSKKNFTRIKLPICLYLFYNTHAHTETSTSTLYSLVLQWYLVD